MHNGYAQNYPANTPRCKCDDRPSQVIPSIQEQIGIDPISKLAAAIEKLAAALEGVRE